MNPIFRVHGSGQRFCQDVTVGDCVLVGKEVTRDTIHISQEQCQSICDAETDCAVFRYDKLNGNCTRCSKDYRQECRSGGGPAVKTIIRISHGIYITGF